MPKVPIYNERTVENRLQSPQYISDTSGATMALAGQINRAGQTAARAVYGIAHAEKQKMDNALVNKAIGDAAFDIENLRSEAEQIEGEDALPAIPASVPGPSGIPISTGAPGRDDPRPLVPRYLEKGDEVFSRAIAMAQTEDQRAMIEAKLPAMRNGFLLRLNEHQAKQNAAVQKANFESTLTYLTNNAAKLYMNPNEMKAAMLPIYEHIDEYSAAHGFPQTDAKDDPADIVVVETRSKVYTQALMNAMNDGNVQYAWDMYFGKGGKGGIKGLKNESDDYGPAILETDKKDIEAALRPLHDAQRGYKEAHRVWESDAPDPAELVPGDTYRAGLAQLEDAFTDDEGNVDIPGLRAARSEYAIKYAQHNDGWKMISTDFHDANVEAVFAGLHPDKVDPSKKRYQTAQQSRALWEIYHTRIAKTKAPKAVTEWGYIAGRTAGMTPKEKKAWIQANPQAYTPRDWHDALENVKGDIEERSSFTKIDRVTGKMFALPKYVEAGLHEGTDDERAAKKAQFQEQSRKHISHVEQQRGSALSEIEIEEELTKLWTSFYTETQGYGPGLLFQWMLPGEQTYGQVDEDSRLWGPEIMARAERDMAAMTPGDWGEVEMGITAPPGFASIEAFEKARKPFEQIQPAHIQQMHEFVAADEELFAEIARESGEAWPREATDAQRKTWLERGMADSSKRKAIEERYERLYAQEYQYPRMMRRPSDLVEKIDGAPIRKLQEETRQRARYVNEAQAVEQGALSWENLPPEAQYRATEQVKYEIWKGIKQPGDDLNPAVLWNAYTRIRAAELQQVNPQGFATTDSPVAAYLWMVDEGISPEHASAATGYNPGKESEQPLRPRQ